MAKMTLAAARVNAGLKQKEAAALMKVSNKTLCSWEKGVSVPKADKIDVICEVYGLTYEDISFLPNNSL